MEALQPSRPPMSQQPPQRIDGNNNNNNNSTVTNPVENKEADKPEILSSPTNNTSNKSNTINNNNNNKDNGIPDVDISKAYKRRSLKKRVECGIFVQIGKQEIEELSKILGAKKCQMFGESFSDNISSCVVCDEQCISGQFAVETVLFIPNKNTKYDNLGRFRTELPRIACHECAAEYQQENNITIKNNDSNNKESLGKIWNMYQNGELNQKQTDQNQSNQSNQTQIQHQHQTSAASLSSINMPVSLPPVAAGNNINDNDDNKIGLPSSDQHQHQHQHHQLPHQQHQQHQSHQHQHQAQGQQVNSPHVHEAERDPFDDGFLICTQLVKTGGADQGGLQVGDVFVEFGHYSKKRFPGLKSIANLVRRSAGKEINVVVWRKLEQMNGVEDDGTGRTVFQKLALKLKPLQSHDADGGGVLGAVINTYPLPEMKN